MSAVLVAAVGGDGVALGVAGQELNVGQRHVGLAGREGAQARQGDDALRGRREGDVLFLVAELEVASVRDLGATVPGSLGDLRLPVLEGGLRRGVAGIFIEGKDAVFARELIVSRGWNRRWGAGSGQGRRPGCRGRVLDRQGVGVGVEASFHLVVQNVLVASERAVSSSTSAAMVPLGAPSPTFSSEVAHRTLGW